MPTDAAVFLDRDGTIIDDRGHLSDPSQVVFLPGVIPALSALQREYRLFIVTHQIGIARGILTPEAADLVNSYVVERLAQDGVCIDHVYCCPHEQEDDCSCIKPKPFFLNAAARQYGIDLARSFSVGDHPQDALLGRNAGGTGLYVLTGHGDKHLAEIPSDTPVFPDLPAAAAWILNPQRSAESFRNRIPDR